MQTITKYLALIMLSLSVQFSNSQVATEIEDSVKLLEEKKETIKNSEKDLLKVEIEEINLQLEKGEITEDEAEDLKIKYAEKRALNIENRLAIVDNKIALLERNEDVSMVSNDDDPGFTLRIGRGDDTNNNFIYLGSKKYDKPRKYDRRTTSDMVLAFGLNNSIVDGQDFDDSPYKIG